MPTKKPNKAKEIIGKIFKDTDLIYGLKEFEDIKIEEVLEITEDESHRFYLADIKTGQKRFVYDEKKGNGKPEEIVRQLWLHKLNQHYFIEETYNIFSNSLWHCPTVLWLYLHFRGHNYRPL